MPRKPKYNERLARVHVIARPAWVPDVVWRHPCNAFVGECALVCYVASLLIATLAFVTS